MADHNNYAFPLKHNTAPLAKLVTLTGGLMPLDHRLPSKKIVRVLRCISASLVGLGLCLVYGIGQSFFITNLFDPSTQLLDIVHASLRYIWHFLGLVTFCSFTWHRRAIYEFMEEWRQLEEPLDTRVDGAATFPVRYSRVYGCFLGVLTVAMTVDCGYTHLCYEEKTPTVIHFAVLKEWNLFYVCYTLVVFLYFHAVVLAFWGDYFAGYVYRHLANLLLKIEVAFFGDLERLVQQKHSKRSTVLKDNFVVAESCKISPRDGGAVSQLWNRYSRLNNLVAKAGKLFAIVLFTSYAVSFYAAFCHIYVLILSFRCKSADYSYLESSYETFVIASMIGVWFGLKLVLVSHLCSSLPKQLARFQRNISCVLFKYRQRIDQEELALLRDLLRRVRLYQWITSPFNLFSIHTSALLSILGLIVTYAIILLQSQCG